MAKTVSLNSLHSIAPPPLLSPQRHQYHYLSTSLPSSLPQILLTHYQMIHTNYYASYINHLTLPLFLLFSSPHILNNLKLHIKSYPISPSN